MTSLAPPCELAMPTSPRFTEGPAVTASPQNERRAEAKSAYATRTYPPRRLGKMGASEEDASLMGFQTHFCLGVRNRLSHPQFRFHFPPRVHVMDHCNLPDTPRHPLCLQDSGTLLSPNPTDSLLGVPQFPKQARLFKTQGFAQAHPLSAAASLFLVNHCVSTNGEQ